MTIFGIFWLLCQGFVALLLFFLVLGIWDHTMKLLRRLDAKTSVNTTKRVYDTPIAHQQKKVEVKLPVENKKKAPIKIDFEDFMKMDPKQFKYVGLAPERPEDVIAAKAKAATIASAIRSDPKLRAEAVSRGWSSSFNREVWERLQAEGKTKARI